MKPLLLAIAFVVGAALLAIALRVLARRKDATSWPVYARKVLSAPEQVLYFRLRDALPDCIVLAQVELTRVIGIKRGAEQRRTWNRMRGMSLDYVVCLKDATVVCAVELDDASHESERGRERHEKKTAILASAGVALVRWRANELPSVEVIRATIAGEKRSPWSFASNYAGG